MVSPSRMETTGPEKSAAMADVTWSTSEKSTTARRVIVVYAMVDSLHSETMSIFSSCPKPLSTAK